MTLTGWLTVAKAIPRKVTIKGWSEDGWPPFFAEPKPPKRNYVSEIAKRALAAITPAQIEETRRRRMTAP